MNNEEKRADLQGLAKKAVNILIVVVILGAIILRICGYKIIYIATNSMEPTLATNQFVIGKRAGPEDVEIGDIVTYKCMGGFYTVTHRIIDIQDDYLIFRGDNNQFADEPVKKDRVAYKIIFY